MSNINVKNRTVFCWDNLDILKGINSESIDLIYLDPPFNKNKTFTAPIDSDAEGADFKDIFTLEDIKDEWAETIKEDNERLYALLEATKILEGKKNYNYCYLCYMGIRLMEMRRILKPTGSIYLHCDQKMSHYLKLLMDCLFGEKNFRNEIIWCYTGPGSPGSRQFPRKSDTIFWYSKGATWTFNGDSIRVPYKKANQTLVKRMSSTGTLTKELNDEYNTRGKIPENWWNIRIAARSKSEYTGYPTQKPLSLLERIIKTSSNKGDVVLDPFCGCATTCAAAEKLERKWIGVDVSYKAFELVKIRLEKEIYPDLFDPDKAPIFKNAIPKRTDVDRIKGDAKWVYVISNANFQNEYKVGVALDYKQRLNSYQTSDPNRAYKLEHKIYTAKYKEMEKHIHQFFNSRHEWVTAKLDDIIAEIKKYEAGE